MNLKKIIIYDYDNLFNILDEIKDYLHLELKKANKENLDQTIKDFKSDCLIISKEKVKSLKNNIILDKIPYKINKIVEVINLNFLKKKFANQSEKKIGFYKIDLNSREISKDSIKLNLTERETNLIMFLSQSSSPVNINQLEREVWNYELKLETHTVETHIYRLRKKIKEKFNDENLFAKDLFTKKYKQRVVKPKKGKGSFKRKKIKV